MKAYKQYQTLASQQLQKVGNHRHRRHIADQRIQQWQKLRLYSIRHGGFHMLFQQS